MTLIKKKRKLQEPKIDEETEIENLNQRIANETPPCGSVSVLGSCNISKRFEDLPISQKSKKALKANSFEQMTDIQQMSIPHALAERDILGAARTGSGKTLAFLVPLLETLFRQRWSISDGLGALVISPTRELALQTFDVLRKVGKHHHFSAGLITGGTKEFEEEQQRLVRMNVLVATPGRLLQHLEQTYGFRVDQLQVLVLDEADRILDMGFKDQLNGILGYLPSYRQTLLFSATQTKSVKDLSRLSLKNPEYIGVHDAEATATPKQLTQIYLTCQLPQKLELLFSFVKTHLKMKIIVFMSSCSQVRFAEALFCKLRPGIPVLALHGKLKQIKRSAVYFDFCNKPAALLFATDIAARGLDFPAVDWVVQVDCPEDKDMYIHRVGRTARYKSGGKALLFLLETEEQPMLKILEESKIPIKQVHINQAKTVSLSKKAAAQVVADVDLKRLAQKAFTSYLRSVMLMPNKEVFKVDKLPLEDFALSLGLATMCSTKFLYEHQNREKVRGKKNTNRSLQRLKEQIKIEKAQKKLGDQLDKLEFQKTEPQKTDSEEDENELLVIKKRHDFSQEEGEGEPEVILQKPTKKKKKIKIRLGRPNVENKKIVFGEDGEAEEPAEQFVEAVDAQSSEVLHKVAQYSQKIKEKLEGRRDEDMAIQRQRVREKHVKKRQKLKGPRPENDDMAGGVTLGGVNQQYSTDESDEEMESSSLHAKKVKAEEKGSNIKKKRKKSNKDVTLDIFSQEEAVLKLLNIT